MSAIPEWVYDDLRPFETSLSNVRKTDLKSFEELLDTQPDENACQAFLAEHPAILAAYGRSGHGEWIVPKPRFADRYVPDFIIGHGHSGGLFWTLIELESPRHVPFNKNGTFSTPLRAAIDQVQSWRIWIEQNQDIVQRPRSAQGLGLHGLRARAVAKIIIGRRSDYPCHYNDLRRKLAEESSIDIISYDRFLEAPRDRAAFWDRPPEERLASMFSDLNITLPKPSAS